MISKRSVKHPAADETAGFFFLKPFPELHLKRRCGGKTASFRYFQTTE